MLAPNVTASHKALCITSNCWVHLNANHMDAINVITKQEQSSVDVLGTAFESETVGLTLPTA